MFSLDKAHRRLSRRNSSNLFVAGLVGVLCVTVAAPSTEACLCNCYPGHERECGFLSWCKFGGCPGRRVNGKLKDGRCKFLGIFFAGAGDVPNAAEALDLWLQAYEVAAASGGGPPDSGLVRAAQSVLLSLEQHEVIRQLAIATEGMYLGWTSYPDEEEHLIGFFTPPEVQEDADCDEPYPPDDHGIVEALDECYLGVGELIRQAMVGELLDPGKGVFDSFMAQVPEACPKYMTYQACEFPHPKSHGHDFGFKDGLSCLSFVMMEPLDSMMAGSLPFGACCSPNDDNICLDVSPSHCENIGGTYQGDATACPPDEAGEEALCSPLQCEGDANGDGSVDPLDSGYVLARFGCPVGTGDPDCDAADQNGDGNVDPLDSGFVLARFGPCE